jgi:hypothetical protein
MTASILARGGWHEKAIRWLARAVSNLQLTAYPFFDDNDPWIVRLEGDPRYERLKTRIKPIWEREMRADRAADGCPSAGTAAQLSPLSSRSRPGV